MNNNCGNKNPLTRGGTSQGQRLLKTLHKDYVHIDEHSYSDLLLFAKNFARQLKYYEKNNLEGGSWEAFFSYDVSILIAFIADNDIQEFDVAFQDLLAELKLELEALHFIPHSARNGDLLDAAKNNLPAILPSFKKLFDYILSLAKHIDQQIDRLPDEVGLKSFAQATIQKQCNAPFLNLLGMLHVGIDGDGAPPNYVILDFDAKEAFPSMNVPVQQYSQDIIQNGLSKFWLADGSDWNAIFSAMQADDYIYNYGGNAPAAMTSAVHVEQWIGPALKAIESVYQSLSKAFFKIVSQSPVYLEETLSEWPDHTPHMALYLSFLKLFRFAQDNLNGVKERHLDFYFEEILRLQKRAAAPDQTFAIVNLAKQVDDFLLAKGTEFKAGKDEDGNDLIYTASEDTAINKAEVAQLKSYYYHPDSAKIYGAAVANSSDGIGEPLTNEDGQWPPFGPVADFIDADGVPRAPASSDIEATEQYNAVNKVAEVGFAIASPNLFLKGGTRTITLNFSATLLDANDPAASSSWSANLFKVLLSGEEGWIEKIPSQSPTFANGKITVVCILSADDPKVVPYNSETHGGTFATTSPMAQVLLPDAGTAHPVYRDLRKYKITQADTEVKVEGLKDLTLQNDIGRLDISSPILPFGGTAKVGSSLIIGSKEVFQKKLKSSNKANGLVNVDLVWDGLEDLGNTYPPPAAIKVSQQYLKENNWSGESSLSPLMSTNFTPSNPLPVNTVSAVGTLDLFDFDFGEDELFKPTSHDGFMRFNLKNSFGQKEFQSGYTKALIELSKTTPDKANVPVPFRGPGASTNIQLKDTPYVPSFKEVAINYTAVSVINLGAATEEDFAKRTQQFFHVHPFGQRELHGNLDVPAEEITLCPQMDFEGELMIGFKNLSPRQSVSVLFQVAEGTANPLKSQQEVVWSYLYQNQWFDFENDDKSNLSDQTNGLLQSGLITFFLPRNISTDNTWFEGNHIWIKASIKQDADAICNLIDVRAQAIHLQFSDQGNSEEVLAAPLAASTIKKLVQPTASIKKVEQPYTSFGGKPKEQSTNFHKRISERLRHKDRAITIWDYEHLVLQEFPEIYKAKCLNHTQLRTDPLDANRKYLNEIAPGYVLLITIPNLADKNGVSTLKPYTSLNTLSKITEFLEKRISPHVRLEVVNPKFEEIELDFQVGFREGRDYTLYKKILNQDILKFLSPWAYDPTTQTELEFGGNICKSVLLDFIEELPYVDFVTEFKMNQIISKTERLDDVEEVGASTPRSILVSIAEHIISEVVNECV